VEVLALGLDLPAPAGCPNDASPGTATLVRGTAVHEVSASLLFVRERQGGGELMLRRDGRVTGPIAGLGYHGHHEWCEGATWSASG
jgi:hypothetical protein